MAKLTARGATVLARVMKDVETPDSLSTVREKEEWAYRSDGTLLWRHVIYWREHKYGEKSHDYGWKVIKKVAKDVTPEQWKRRYLADGWTSV